MLGTLKAVKSNVLIPGKVRKICVTLCLQRDDKEMSKGAPVSLNGNVPDGRDLHDRKDAGIKP